MTDRLKGLVVAFDADIRDYDAQPIINAILMIKGVYKVTTELADASDFINRSMIRMDMDKRLIDALKD